MKIHCAYDKLIETKELIPHPKNRNIHPQEQIDRLAKILLYQGWRYPVKVSKLSGFITSGHGRLLAAAKNGWNQVPVNYQDYEDEVQEYSDVQADNAIASWASLDLSGINSDIQDLGPFDVDFLGLKDFKIDVSELDQKTDDDSDKENPERDEQEIEENEEIPDKIEPQTKLHDHFRIGAHELYNGDCLERMKLLQNESIHALVSDPPCGIAFMGKDWDEDKGGSKEWTAWMTRVMEQAFRVLKPGAHGLVWAIPRTAHWTMQALEDAGFNIRDVIVHCFGSGFPKSLDISKAIDKAAGSEREVVGDNPRAKQQTGQKGTNSLSGDRNANLYITAPSTPAAEHWVLVRKPIASLDNVMLCLRQLESLWFKLDALSAEKNLNPTTAGSKRGKANTAQESAQIPTAEEKEQITETGEAELSSDQMDISQFDKAMIISLSIVSSWKVILDASLEAMNTSTIRTKINQIIDFQTLNSFLSKITPENIIQDVSTRSGLSSHALSASQILINLKVALSETLTLSVLEDAGNSADSSLRMLKKLQMIGQGSQTAPSSEHWVLVRKPISEKTVAANALVHGCGGLNIDASRIGFKGPDDMDKRIGKGVVFEGNTTAFKGFSGDTKTKAVIGGSTQGRFPANFILSHNPDCVEMGMKNVKASRKNDEVNVTEQNTKFGQVKCNEITTIYGNGDGTETVAAFECTPFCAVAELDRQSGNARSSGVYKPKEHNDREGFISAPKDMASHTMYADSGGASRFFQTFHYFSKPSKREKNDGCEELQEKQAGSYKGRADGSLGKITMNINVHPTVKSLKLMSYLINMVTPPGGTLIDPFGGSGTTLVASELNGFKSILFEQSTEYCDIILARAEKVTKVKAELLNG